MALIQHCGKKGAAIRLSALHLLFWHVRLFRRFSFCFHVYLLGFCVSRLFSGEVVFEKGNEELTPNGSLI